MSSENRKRNEHAQCLKIDKGTPRNAHTGPDLKGAVRRLLEGNPVLKGTVLSKRIFTMSSSVADLVFGFRAKCTNGDDDWKVN